MALKFSSREHLTGLMQPGPECITKYVLKSRYHANLRVYTEATRSMEAAVGTARFKDESERVIWAQKVFEHCKAELQRHCDDHGCSDLEQAVALSTS